MDLYPEMAAAMQADDADRYGALLADDFEYLRHTTGETLDREQMTALLRRVWADGNRTIEDLRCLYENDDILVVHTRLRFASGSREAALIVNLKRDGKVVRTESGVTALT